MLLSYVTIWDAAHRVVGKGAGALMVKVDIKQAYRNIPLHPDERGLMGMSWDGGLFIDTALPFGLRLAPKIFNAVADAVEWILKHQGAGYVIYYLDDFLLVGRRSSEECAEALSTFLRVFNCLGLPVAIEKLEGPTSCLTFLGFPLDSCRMEIHLPHTKLVKLLKLLRSWLGRRTCCRKELESLVGKLAHASTVVYKTGKDILMALLAGTRKVFYHVRLGLSSQSDLLWWLTFAEAWNGALIQTHPRLTIYGLMPQVALVVGQWNPSLNGGFNFKWPVSYHHQSVGISEDGITLQELLPIVMACAIWRNHWRGSECTATIPEQ